MGMEIKLTQGFAKIPRSLQLDADYQRLNVYARSILIHLIINASCQKRAIEKWYGGGVLESGQLVTSMSEIGLALGASQTQVRSSLERLKESGFIDTQKAPKGMIITLLHWQEWQGEEE